MPWARGLLRRMLIRALCTLHVFNTETQSAGTALLFFLPFLLWLHRTNSDTRRLDVVQQPKRARMCGFGDKVRTGFPRPRFSDAWRDSGLAALGAVLPKPFSF